MLQEYEEKRHFRRTPEPPPRRQEREGPLVFVVQKHAARRLHYDFRLELDGVLKSWAVPSGPSRDPKVKRLAVMVEDHPLDYGSFEGVIPEGEYGAGEVIVWDRGTYSPEKDGNLLDNRNQAQEVLRDGLARGKISIFLRGGKLEGSWTLVKMKGKENQWLFIKHQDEFAGSDQDKPQNGTSVISGLSLEDLKSGRQPARHESARIQLESLPGARKAGFPESVMPMLATLTNAPFSDPDWFFEPKLDGYRIIAQIKDGDARLLSRGGLDVTQNYPQIAEGLKSQPATTTVLDGEIVALDKSGKPCFQCLQGHLKQLRENAISGGDDTPIIYYIFDILYLDGYDLTDVALKRRKEVLPTVLRGSDQIRPVEYFAGDGEALYEAAIKNGLEGVMAKHENSFYEPGHRSRDWLKVKAVLSDEFIIGGYSQGQGIRSHSFGALLLGYYDEQNRLIYAGHVGTGFAESTLGDLRGRMDALRSDRCPFATTPPLNAPTTWLRPELVAEVKFAQWTRDGYLRAPVFMRLRDDKPPQEVRRAEAVTAPVSQEIEPRKNPENPGSVLKQLNNPGDNLAINVEGHRIALTNLNKELWPAVGDRRALTKRDLLVYLEQVSPYILPHLHDRPLSLSRYPGGIHGEPFWQKHWDNPLPEFVATARISVEGEGLQEYLLCNNLPTLLWLGQLADIELHTWFSRVTSEHGLAEKAPKKEAADFFVNYPDFLIFDIDPYIYSGKETRGAEPELNRRAFARTCEVALWLKEILDSLSFSAFVKTSGKTGLHVYVPILREFDFHAVHSAARTICLFLQQKHPQEVTMEWSVEKRTGKVFLDYNQNVRGKTLASLYSPRPTPEATVSMPLRWEELGKAYPTDFTLITTPERLKKTGDLWAGILDAGRDLRSLPEK